MNLKYEPSSVPLHISAKQLFKVSKAVLAMRAIKFNVWERQFEQRSVSVYLGEDI